jgi:hypothetical protein
LFCIAGFIGGLSRVMKKPLFVGIQLRSVAVLKNSL